MVFCVSISLEASWWVEIYCDLENNESTRSYSTVNAKDHTRVNASAEPRLRYITILQSMQWLHSTCALARSHVRPTQI